MDVQNICKKDQLTKFANAENTNNPNQDKIVAALRQKLRSSGMKQKEMEATLAKLKKANKITKVIAEYQTETVKLLQEKKMSQKSLNHFGISRQSKLRRHQIKNFKLKLCKNV